MKYLTFDFRVIWKASLTSFDPSFFSFPFFLFSFFFFLLFLTSDVTLFGSPPHLTLKMTLRELTSQDVGKWHFTIANDLGSDKISFSLEINGLPGTHRKIIMVVFM